MSSDETFLESFLDSLSGLPHEIKRNLELMKDLDKTCTTLQEDVKQRQQEYIHQAEEKVLALDVVESPAKDDGTSEPGIRVSNGQVVIQFDPR